MAGEEKLHLGEFRHALDGTAKDGFNNIIIKMVGICLSVVDTLSDVVLDVGSSDQLDGEGPAFLMGEVELMCKFVI